MLKTILLCCLAAVTGGPLFAAESRPNIVFILSDDLAMGDIGCYGQKLIRTPNIDRLATEGMRFTQAYTGTSVCAPARASLMTGLHTGHCPIRANREIGKEGQMPLPKGTYTVAHALKEAGYATACIGKWGMGMFDTSGSPLKMGFDHFFGYNCQRHAHSYFPEFLYRNSERFSLPGNDGKGVGRTYAQNLIADEVDGWIKANKDHPFFLFYAITLPHARAEIDDLGDYATKDWTPLQKTYAAQVTRLDTDLGRLMKTLKELGLDERTIVWFAGDNGSSYAPNSEIGRRFDQTSTGLRGYKRSLYEGALRQAAFVRWPGHVPAGKVVDDPWAFWDFFPTAVEMARAKVPPGLSLDGKSLVPMLAGKPLPQRDYFYWELHETTPMQAARFGQWKAVRNRPGTAIELYDLNSDRGELKNLAADHPDQVKRAAEIMMEARTEDPNWPFRAAN